MENTLSSADVFLLSVKETILNWSILKIAKDHGFGGTDVLDKEVWLADSIVQIFKDNGKQTGTLFLWLAFFNEKWQ